MKRLKEIITRLFGLIVCGAMVFWSAYWFYENWRRGTFWLLIGPPIVMWLIICGRRP